MACLTHTKSGLFPKELLTLKTMFQKIILPPKSSGLELAHRMNLYCSAFAQLIATPFEHASLIWGIVPLYFGWLLNELTSSKASFRTAIQTGFSFLWAAAQWLSQYFTKRDPQEVHRELHALPAVNLAVTALVLLFGLTALISGVRQRFPKYGKFLGHTRFANYFMIAIYPIQSHWLDWTWLRLEAIALFAVPVWLVLYFGLMPFRK